jgi:carbon-monoxide dehydrogenase medium subunit/xanthine dehydrogenase FAD-binding subunit
MLHFQFFNARSIEEALSFLEEKGEQCRIIAGGTDLIPALRREDVHPDFIMNILEINQLKGIAELDHAVRIGPTTTFTEMIESDILFRFFPSLVQSASSVGGPQVRNRGTIGGNIANASPAADVLPAVLAYDGELELQSKVSGKRILRLSEAIEGPYKTCFRPDEMLTGIIIKKPKLGTRSLFEKLGRRNAMARARMNLTILLRLNGKEEVSEIRIVPGAVMPVARRAMRTEEMFLGKRPEPSLIGAASEVIAKEMVEVTGIRWSTEYKVPVLKNMFKRIMLQLIR